MISIYVYTIWFPYKYKMKYEWILNTFCICAKMFCHFYCLGINMVNPDIEIKQYIIAIENMHVGDVPASVYMYAYTLFFMHICRAYM